MIAYYCDRCGKEIVDGTIYRVAITVESSRKAGKQECLKNSRKECNNCGSRTA